MARTSAIRNFPSPGWGGLTLESRPAPGLSLRRAGREHRGPRFSGAAEIAVGALLVVVWAMLWALFITGVVEPAAGMQARPAAHAAAALRIARPGAGPGPVDTTGTAP